ncbi:MAG: tetratricopeptide repeat protein [Spirosomataceae bacterium]
MKTLSFIFFLMLIFSNVLAQNKQITDSLKHQLRIAKHDTSRVKVMSELCLEYRLSKLDLAMNYGKQALALAQKVDFPQSEAMASISLGFAYRESGDLPKALKLIIRALKLLEETNDLQGIANAKNSLGLIYWDLKDFTKALKYFHQAKSLSERWNLSRRLASVQNNIGVVFMEMNQFDSAKYYLTQAYENNLRLGSKGVNPLRNLGSLEDKLGNHRRALAIFGQCWKINDSSDVRNSALLNNIMAESYQSINKFDSAIFYASRGLDLAKRGPYRKRIIQAYSILKEAYKSKGDFKLALQNEELLVAESDSLSGATIQVAVSQEEENQVEIENNKKQYQNQLKQYALLVGLGVVLLIVFILYRNNRKEKKAKALLQEQKEKVETTLSQLKSTQTQLIQKEKLASLGELTAGIAHEIQNPLNFVNNFSELSVELVDELKSPLTPDGGIKDGERVDMELMEDIVQNLEKINLHGKRASSIVKGMLEHSRMGTGERVLTDMNTLCDEYLRLSYHGMRAKDNQFNADFELIADPNLPKINVVPQDIGRVLLNLINNAFYAVHQRITVEARHALPLPSPYQPTVTILTNTSGNRIEIRVQDNGTGIPANILPKIFQPFFTTKPTGEGTGLGLSLAYDIVTKGHGGTLEVESIEGEGTTFVVKLPI